MNITTLNASPPPNALTTVLIITIAFLAVFFQASFDSFRNVTGVQVDLLPSLMVYAALSAGLGTLTALALIGGLCFDSLSANPLGTTVLPLFLIGFAVQYFRPLVLRDQIFAQLLLGLGASASAPLLTFLLLLNGERQPLLGWGSLWHWLIISLVGASVTPLWFQFFSRVSEAINYKSVTPSSFRPDRQIKRGRH